MGGARDLDEFARPSTPAFAAPQRSNATVTAETAIEVDGVGKRYVVGEHEQYLALSDIIAQAPRNVARQVLP